MQMTTDPESTLLLASMAEQEKTKSNRVPGVRTVLIVLVLGRNGF